MEFSLKGYGELLDLLDAEKYEFADYHNWIGKDRCVILRHDIDTEPEAALKMARFEATRDVKSTYFVLLSTDMYNPASATNKGILKEIVSLGHEVGLHFDEIAYDELDPASMRAAIIRESDALSAVLEQPVKSVSMHRPSAGTLESDLHIPGIVNSYGKTFFKEFKYLSDSRMRWREPVEEIVKSGDYDRLHILTHAFWYKDKDMKSIVTDFIEGAPMKRYVALRDNFTDLEEVVSPDELF